ncbi:MAG: hypothetical protein GEV12_13455 [Micromonosporaceae bacterium]|nr:hypothetical protein [Micromonosporaceae bacterium]
MAPVTRLRAYTGLWTLVGLLGLALVFVAAAAGPVNRHSEDRALRATVDQAPMSARDLLAFEPVDVLGAAISAERARASLTALTPTELAEVTEAAWGAQRSRIERPTGPSPGLAVSLTGERVRLEPSGLLPLVTLHHQPGLDTELRMVSGTTPQTEPADQPAAAVVEVMVATRVADALGLRVGETYHLLLGVAARLPFPVAEATDPVVAIRVAGIFEPLDPAGAIWQIDHRLLRAVHRSWPAGAGQEVPLQQATLVTDQAGIDTLLDLQLNSYLEIENVARVRLAAQRLDATWIDPGRQAVSALLSSPQRRPELRLETGLLDLLDEFERQAGAARAVTAVVAAGLVGTGAGLLLLAAGVTVDRRRSEISLLRARGGSLSTVVRRFLVEAVLALGPAVAAGWLLHRLLPGRPDPGLVLGVGAVPLAVAALAVLAVPVTVAVAGRRPRRRGAGPPGGPPAGPPRVELTRQHPSPVRLTVELVVVLLAGLGVLLLHQRGLTVTPAGADPYLSAVPVLIGLAAGLLALRAYPWPLRVLGTLSARGRGAVGFLGLARAGRAAPAAALPLLVLVLAVAVGGFAGAVYASVAAARDTAAVQGVGADLRVRTGGDLPDRTVAEVAALPGVDTVAAVNRSGFVRVDGRVAQNVVMITVDGPAYQEVLAAIGAPDRLPEAIRTARPGSGPVPVLGPAPDPGQELSVELAGTEHPATVVGDVAGLPALAGGDWVLVPRNALPAAVPVDELLIAGSGADPAAVRDAVARRAGDPEAVTVTSLADQRAALEASGFNQTLTLVFIIGTVGAAVGGLLAVGLALAVQAAARGRALSQLRTMGLSAGQARGLLLVELVPVAALAVAAGAATGTVMPALLAPALGLTEFTGGASLPVALNPGTAALLAGLLGVLVLGGTLTEVAINRRLGLGQTLRL